MAAPELRARLRQLQFLQPLGDESVALVQALVNSLVDSRGRLSELGARADAHTEELRLAQNQASRVARSCSPRRRARKRAADGGPLLVCSGVPAAAKERAARA